jgi:hypothetical protein
MLLSIKEWARIREDIHLEELPGRVDLGALEDLGELEALVPISPLMICSRLLVASSLGEVRVGELRLFNRKIY